MTLRTVHPARFAAAGGALLALLAIALVVLGSRTVTRTDLLGSLERPAVLPTASLGPHRVAVAVPAGEYRLGLRVSPNRAAARPRATPWQSH